MAASLTMVKLDSYMWMNKARSLSRILHKLNSKCIKDLDKRHDALRLLEDKVRNVLELVQGRENDFQTGLQKHMQ